MSDLNRVRHYLGSHGDASWSKPGDEDYVRRVVAEMESQRAAHPDGDYPSPTHGLDDIGACVTCDALQLLLREDDALGCSPGRPDTGGAS